MHNDSYPKYFVAANGNQFGLHASRWDERHRRLRITLPEAASAWDYAPLIDMVRPANRFQEYRYLGVSALEWLVSMRSRRDPDYPRALEWFFARIRKVRRKLDQRPRAPDHHYAVELARPPMQPSLPRLLADLNLRRATIPQWISTLRGLTGKGLRAEELQQSALVAMLEVVGTVCSNEIPTTIDRLLQRMDLSHLYPRLVVECMHGFATKAGWRTCCERIVPRRRRGRGAIGNGRDELEIIRYRHRTFGWSLLRRTLFADLLRDREDRWLILDERGRPVLPKLAAEFADEQQAMDAAEALMSERFLAWRRSHDAPRWEDYSLPGGNGYREILVQIDDWPHNYQPRHFGTRNVLAHIRSSVRQTIDGRRVLYLDEVQSDWHADLHFEARADLKRRRKTVPPPAPFAKEWPLLAMKLMLWFAQKQHLDGLAWSTPELQRLRWGCHAPPDFLYRRELPESAQQLAKILSLEYSSARLNFRGADRLVEISEQGWRVLDANSAPMTKPFRHREQAEKFADLVGKPMTQEIPVIWLNGLPMISAIPLYGVGSTALWLGIG